MDGNVQTETLEPTTQEQEPQANDTRSPETAPEATPQADGSNEGEGVKDEGAGTKSGTEPAQAPLSEESKQGYMTVRYNHADRSLTEEEARRYAQMGMKYEDTKSIYDRLDYGAALAGVSVDKFVDDIIAKPENEYRKQLEEMYGVGSQEVEIGMDVWRAKQKADYQKVIDDRKQREAQAEEQKKTDIRIRLADEYIELKREIPDVPEYENLPDSVIREAASGKRDLLSCYLRWERQENIKIEAAKKTEQAANNASAGQMQTSENRDGSLADAFGAGVWGR